MTIGFILLLLAFICFLLATIPVPVRINLVALGLALWVLSLLIGSFPTHLSHLR
jgi:hypothetical protein